MKTVNRTKIEYGGFLPLELNPGHEWFEEYNDNMLRFNSVKASIDYLIRNKGITSILVPYYYCPSTTDAIVKTGINVTYYHINDNLVPDTLPDKEDECILLVDFFGIKTEEVNRIAESFIKANVIIDNAHAFYSKPLIKRNIYNVYSAKKFFGIPDGSYVIGEDIEARGEELGYSYEFAQYLLTTYELGTNAAYVHKKEADRFIEGIYAPMSALAVGLLQNVDYERVRIRRRDNYQMLQRAFLEINAIDLPSEAIPYQFPLLIKAKGVAIKQKLVKDKIFVSTLWSGKKLMKEGNTFELNMSQNAVFLPLDQRYGREDMDYIIQRVKEFVDENT